MKADEFRKKTNEELLNIKRDLELGLIKASSGWGSEKVSKKESGTNAKANIKKGAKTSLSKEIRKNIARILTIINERKNEKQ